MAKARRARLKVTLVLASTGALLVLAVAKIVSKARFRLMDDGVYWEVRDGSLMAKRVDPRGPAADAGLSNGDVLLAIDGVAVTTPHAVQDVIDRSEGQTLSYQVVRIDERRALAVQVAPLPRGNLGLYYYQAGVGIFALIVGAVVYVRRRGLPAVAHFYALSLFWFLGFSFSFTGKLDFWDSLFYWMDWAGNLFFPAIFLHFALTFPRRNALVPRGAAALWLVYVPSVVLVGLLLAGKLMFFTYSSKIDYGFTEAMTPQGHIGVQVWINQGMYQEDETDGADAQEGQAPKKPKRTYKR